MEQIIFFTALVLFPFGQVIKIGIITPLDMIVGIGAIFVVIKKYNKPQWFKLIDNFLIFAFASWLFSVFYFWDIKVLYGFLYLIRLCSYFYFSLLVYHYAYSLKHRALLINSLISLSQVSSLFGWIQFFKFPDIRPFFAYGWDEHLFRMVGTFLDPTFLGLILVFGILISFYNKKYLISIFLLISLFFTYSRASYLALFVGMIFLTSTKKYFKYVILGVIFFLFLAFINPTLKNQSNNVRRQFSAIARIENYQSIVKLVKTSPAFGVGYNNLCFAKNKHLYIEDYKSHACSGSDSGILLILSTMGVVGLIVFVGTAVGLWKVSNLLTRSLLLTYLVHSQFSNSIFYPWVLFYLLTIFVGQLGGEKDN